MGRGSAGPSVPPCRWSAAASSSAKKGLPSLVSQIRINARSGERRVETGAHQLMEGADAEARDLEALQPVRRYGATQPVGYVAANSEQSGDRLGIEACEREAHGRQRCRIQPLQVVDRETQRAILDEHADRREKAAATARSSAWASARPRSKAASAPDAGSRAASGDVVGDACEQIRQTGEREAGLRVGGARGEDPVAQGGGRLAAGEPEGGLADPRVARQDDDAWKGLGAVEEADDGVEPPRPADELAGGDGRAPIVSIAFRGAYPCVPATH